MKLLDSDTYLQLVAADLDATRNSDDPAVLRRAVQLAMQCADELLARRTRLPALLRTQLQSGVGLARELASLIDSGAPVAAELASFAAPAADLADFDRLATRYNGLLDLLSRGFAAACASDERRTALIALMRRAASWELAYRIDRQQVATDLASARGASSNAALELTVPSLAAALASHGETAAEVDHLRVLSGGMGKLTYQFDLRDASGGMRPMIVRKEVPQQLLEGRNARLVDEFALLQSLQGCGLPVPAPILLCADSALSDTPFIVMPKMPGVVPATFFGPTIEISKDLIRDLARCLAQLHAVPLEHFRPYLARQGSAAILGETVSACYRRLIDEWRAIAGRLGLESSLTLRFLFDWLGAHVPDDDRCPVLTHGDSNFHNVLVVEQKISALLDWELADFGAPEQDLIYLRRQLTPLIDWDEFIDCYVAAGGREIRQRDLDFYLAYQFMRLCVASCTGVAKLLGGESRDPRLLEIDLNYLPLTLKVALDSTRASQEGEGN